MENGKVGIGPFNIAIDHYEGFELEAEYYQIWDKIRFAKVNEFEKIMEKITAVLRTYDHCIFVATPDDYTEVYELFKKMKLSSVFYMAKDAKNLICTVNPKFVEAFKEKECIRKLKYIHETDNTFTYGKIYESSQFNGATYHLKNDLQKIVSVGCGNFERV